MILNYYKSHFHDTEKIEKKIHEVFAGKKL